jgi:hypothetical protein
MLYALKHRTDVPFRLKADDSGDAAHKKVVFVLRPLVFDVLLSLSFIIQGRSRVQRPKHKDLSPIRSGSRPVCH